MSTWSGERLSLRYDPGRAGRQLVGFGLATLLMIALGALGVWMVIGSLEQLDLAGKIVGCGFGIFFFLLALATVVSAVEVLTKVLRQSRQADALVVVDDRGLDGLVVLDGMVSVGQPHIDWDEISSLTLGSHLPGARRTNALARLDSGYRLRAAVQGGLDRTAGTGLGMRDGRRSIELELVDGRSALRDLTLPLSPQSFADIAPRLVDLAHAHDVEVHLSGNLLA